MCATCRSFLRVLACVGIVAATEASPQAALAQTPAEETRGQWVFGGSVGLPGYGSDTELDLFVVGVQFSQLIPGQLAADFAIGTMPRVLLEGILPIGARAGVVLAVPAATQAMLLPSAGASLIAAGGMGGATAEFGVNAGLGLLVGDPRGTALRTGVTWHRFRELGGTIWLFEFGFSRSIGR